MATPFYITLTIEYEDAKGNLTGDSDQFVWYLTDVAAARAQLNATGGNTFIFTRGPGRITDMIAQAAATVTKVQLEVNNLPRNITWLLAAQVALALRTRTNIRIAGGSQISLIQA